VSYLREDIRHDQRPHLFSVTSLFGAAQVVGQAIRKVWENDGRYLKEFSTDFVASFIFGGQISGGPHGMFMIYNAGNFIEASPDTPFSRLEKPNMANPF